MRVTGGIQTKKTHNKYMKMAKGFRGGRRVLFRSARGGVEKGLAYAFRDRKARKREMRSLWITRIGAAAKGLGVSYSKLIDALNKAEINLNRKVLSNLAAEDPGAFQGIVDDLRAKSLI
jgi:large subunit ribosomal protein L20